MAMQYNNWVWKRFKRHVLLAMAKTRRACLKDCSFVGITGSCAKTTTKTLLAGLIPGNYHLVQNPGSENYIGTVAKTILKAKRTKSVCIQEIGAGSIGSLDAMVRLYKPTIAVITTIMRDHYSAFRSKAAIAAEKGKLVAALPVNGTAVLNADDPLVADMQKLTRARCITYGISEGADLRLVEIRAVWPAPLTATVVFGGQAYPLRTSLFGVHSATAVMAALAAAIALGVTPEYALGALAKIPAPSNRMQAQEDGRGVTFVLDDIKAPLDGMPAICHFTAEARAKRKILVLGTISDYPGSSSSKYRQIAREALSVADLVFWVGAHGQSGLKGQPVEIVNHRLFGFRHLVDLNHYLQPQLQPGDLVILKGSKKPDHLERLLIARGETVVCWRSGCGRLENCQQCNHYRSQFIPMATG
jgi:UDP-N-acetylmuramoyl-tripeptide--D-alanyl-D-alanine ligase